jgi:hypothetical protein
VKSHESSTGLDHQQWNEFWDRKHRRQTRILAWLVLPAIIVCAVSFLCRLLAFDLFGRLAAGIGF